MSFENKKIAVVIGATGATGVPLLLQLLEDPTFSKVKIFIRRQISLTHPKLEVHVIDFDRLNDYQSLIGGDVLFSTLGTTKKDAKSEKAQWKVDFDYQYQFAKLAKENGVKCLVLVSSTGANENDKFFYYRLKGTLDKRVKELQFSQTFIFRPPVLIRPSSTRFFERLLVHVFTFLNRCGLLKNQKPLKVEDLAKVMIASSKKTDFGYHIIEKEQIRELMIL